VIDPKHSAAARALAVCLALAAWPGCSDEAALCAGEEPAFQVDLLAGDKVQVSLLKTLHVTVKAGNFSKTNVKLPLGNKLLDGSTSFVVVLGQEGTGGFTADVLVLAKDAARKVRAHAKQTFTGTGDACNFFEMTLQAGEPPSQDLDGDGESSDTDCDDDDPCRSNKLTEAANFCKIDKAKFAALSAACKAALAKAGKTSAPPHCGDGIDQDCDGKDAACLVDADCDGYSPPADCKDDDKAIHPGAKELCDGVDNDCDKVVDEGCVQCDVDGDGYANPMATGAACKVPKTDSDDFDAGINPGTTKDTGGKEGGTVKAALRMFCSYKETKNSSAAKKWRHRDLDHDGDKLIAVNDGCPADACDKDGDGFPNASCSPPKATLDCNDSDHRVFPGAPDRCGDGVAQDCIADSPCAKVTDKDGDRWSPPHDCNDNAPKVHPWATEKCDRVDNDCDGLIDEGNPDASGKLIPSYPFTCTDDNDGQCAPKCTPGSKNCSAKGRTLSGTCACSALKPTSKRDAKNRVACTGEDLSATASPRCFGATQPSAERCDDKDHDCDGKAYAKGQSFAGLGKACSVATGICTVGKVTGCDPSKAVPNYALVKQVDPSFQEHWKCSGTLPVAEVCDGKDDDCDGAIPTTEMDGDGDGYLPCSKCTKGSGVTCLASSLSGCDDCKDSDKSVHPGAKELCNGVDDNCLNAVADDGKDQCAATGRACCSTQKACKLLSNDKLNCGKCGYICPTGTSDGCKSKLCVCGSSPACGSGQVCKGGKCVTSTCGSTNCTGCCSGNTCVKTGSMTLSKCGKGGAACKSCDSANDCVQDACTSGVCTQVKKTDGLSCKSGAGKCAGGVCCQGCVSSGKCYAGTSTSKCGAGGGTCGLCGSSQCQKPTCSKGKCGTTPANNGTSCSGGKCYKGSCCKGCWTGSKCVSSGSINNCGKGGVKCVTCKSQVCKTVACSSGACKYSNKSNGTSCSGGKCRNGACCKGCWDGSKCQLGKNNTNCGSGGKLCSKCSSTNTCKTMSCATGVCASGNKADKTTCSSSGKNGTCLGGVCCTGCVSGSTCLGGTTTGYCGSWGLICVSCKARTKCQNGICLPMGP